MVAIQADEHVPRPIVHGLRARGIEAFETEDEALDGASDQEIMAFCRRTDRVLLTNHDHFLAEADAGTHPGLLYLTEQYAATGKVVDAVVHLVDIVPRQEFRKQVFWVP